MHDALPREVWADWACTWAHVPLILSGLLCHCWAEGVGVAHSQGGRDESQVWQRDDLSYCSTPGQRKGFGASAFLPHNSNSRMAGSGSAEAAAQAPSCCHQTSKTLLLPALCAVVGLCHPPADLLPQSWGCMWAPSPCLGHVTLGALLCLISPKVGPAVEGPTGRGTQPLPADFPPPPSLWCLCKAVGAGIVEDAGFRRRVGRKSPWTAAPTPAIPNPAQEEGTSLFSFEEPTPHPQEPDSLPPPF